MKISRLIASVLLLGAISTPCLMSQEPQDLLLETLRHLREQYKLLTAKSISFLGEEAIAHAKKVNDLELAIIELENSRGVMERFKANKTKAIIVGVAGGILIIGGLIYVIKKLYDAHQIGKESEAIKKARENESAKHKTDMENLIAQLRQATDTLGDKETLINNLERKLEDAKLTSEKYQQVLAIVKKEVTNPSKKRGLFKKRKIDHKKITDTIKEIPEEETQPKIINVEVEVEVEPDTTQGGSETSQGETAESYNNTADVEYTY
jgi:hypothetical protein